MTKVLDIGCRALAIILVVLLFCASQGYFDRAGALSAPAIKPWGGKAFIVGDISPHFSGPRWIEIFYANGDNSSEATASALRVFENGRPLGPPHAMHADVAAEGDGRYSHWGNALIFSASDGSDPRVNGRVYTLTEPTSLWRVGFVPALLLAGLLACRQRGGFEQGLPEIRVVSRFLTAWRRPICYGASLSLAAYIFGLYAYGMPPVPLISPDSNTYWTGRSIVPIGYPAFIWATYGIFGSLRAVVLTQVVLYELSVIAVQYATERVTGSAVVSSITAIALLTVGATLSSAIWLLSESIFATVLLFHIAAAGSALARPSRVTLVSLAGTALLAITVRPAGYFLYGGPLFLLLFWKRQRKFVFRWAVCPLVFLSAVYFDLSLNLRDEAVGGNAAGSLYPHVAPLLEPSKDPVVGLDAVLAGEELKSYKEARRNTTDWHELQILEQQYFNPISHESRLQLESKVEQIQSVLMKLSLYAIKNHQIGYIKIVFENIYYWYTRLILDDNPLLGSYLAATYERFWEEIVRLYYGHNLTSENMPSIFDPNTYRLTQSALVLSEVVLSERTRNLMRITFLLISTAALLWLVFGSASVAVSFIAYVAILAFGGALLVSLSTVFIPRYAIPLDPFVLIVVIVGGSVIFRSAMRHSCRFLFRRARAGELSGSNGRS